MQNSLGDISLLIVITYVFEKTKCVYWKQIAKNKTKQKKKMGGSKFSSKGFICRKIKKMNSSIFFLFLQQVYILLICLHFH